MRSRSLLLPGDTINMTFKVSKLSRGFNDGHERAELAYNGTFVDSGYFPTIGYDANIELTDPRRRREEHLGELELLPARGDKEASLINLFSPQADWIHYRTTVSTCGDQIALSPGYLVKDWKENGRHYFTYDMGEVQMADFFAYISGAYEVTRDTYQGANGPVAIEVYHDPAHRFDVQDMIDASKAGLAFYEKAFSPFQFSPVPNSRVSALSQFRAVISKHCSIFGGHRLYRKDAKADRH